MMRKLRSLALLTALAVLAAPAVLWAHGKGHVMGTVAAVDATHLEIKTKEGKTVTVTLNDKTKYKKGDAEGASADVKPGMKVSVHLADDGSAGEVHLPADSGSMKH